MSLNRDNLRSEDLLFIKQLFMHEYVSLFALHSEFMLSVEQIFTMVDKFAEQNLIKITPNDDREVNIRLTTRGRSWLLSNENWLIQGNVSKFWREIPSEFLQPQLAYDSDYEPGEKDILELFGD